MLMPAFCYKGIHSHLHFVLSWHNSRRKLHIPVHALIDFDECLHKGIACQCSASMQVIVIVITTLWMERLNISLKPGSPPLHDNTLTRNITRRGRAWFEAS